MNRKNIVQLIGLAIFFLFIIFSLAMKFNPGEEILSNFISFLIDMLKILPCAFLFIGLFDVWVKKTTIEKHLSGFKGFTFAILLAGTTVGGLYVAFPVTYSLYKKGVKLSIIFTYLFASAVCRVPMTVFEASFLGFRFTLIRLLTSLPLIIMTSILLEKYLEKNHYKLKTQ